MDRTHLQSKQKHHCCYFAACLVFLFTAVTVRTQDREHPPSGCNPCRASDLVELVKLDSTIKLDIRYATDNNFMGKPVYPEPRAFLQRPAAEALVSAHHWLKQKGYGLVVYDAYRPWSVTKLFWDLTPPEKQLFVADPSVGSVHNRGCAVDVGLYEITTGRVVDMPSGFDEFSERSSINHAGGTAGQRACRDLLRKAMEREGLFFVYTKEWWHYNFRDYGDYPVLDIPFSDIRSPEETGKSDFHTPQ